MKKAILIFIFAISCFSSIAQENMMSKRGTPILPEVGDFAVFFDATPFFYYAGNMFNQNGNTAPTADFTYNNPYTITGLYVYAPNSAYRGKVRLGFGSDKQEELVPILGNNPYNLQTTNTTKVSGTNITLGGGVQKSRGKGRLRGNYGVEASLMFGTGLDTTYTYGQGLLDTLPPQFSAPRTTKANAGGSFGIGARAFITIEYFFAPKISVSAQYGWGIDVTTTGASETTQEFIDNTSGSPVEKTTTTKTGKTTSFGADVDNNGASIAIGFYF